MRLFRFGAAGKERPGVVLAGGRRVDVSGFGSDYDEEFFGADGVARLRAWVDANGARCPQVAEAERLGPVVKRPSKIVCVGMNFHVHAREQGQEPPKEPVLFMKATTALCGPNDDLVLPRGSVKTDWEVELAVVIGKRASYVEKPRRWSTWPGSCCTTITPSANTSSSAGASGTRARAATPSRRWARSWSPATR